MLYCLGSGIDPDDQWTTPQTLTKEPVAPERHWNRGTRQTLMRLIMAAVTSWLLTIAIGGFHVTQISLIITQVKNKIVYHSIY